MGETSKSKTNKMASAVRGSGMRWAAGWRTLTRLRTPHACLSTPVSDRSLSTSAKRPGGDDHWYYRHYGRAPTGWTDWGAQGIFFVMYWWFFHNIIYDPGHIVGPGMPFAGDFTDEELGLPPEEEE